ncbi:E3 ubiquitin-protein ligase arih1-like [Salvelinus namaycush]|uniref:E3 ubiquitin-protein ligase arih1-like n=1 Tax=Salvelinus namaycush TaxID=8040 RepID=A0A8U0PWB3_SALNM|nr:E3 ubiquitin-protein ligase arih1-like [Salvelinus namaycush]
MYEQEIEQENGNVIIRLQTELKQFTLQKATLVEESYQCIIKLEEIALKSLSLSTALHLGFLIDKMKETGNTEKVQKLEEMKKRAEEQKGAFDYFKAGVVGKIKDSRVRYTNRVLSRSRSKCQQKQCKFICPASRKDGETCGAEWSYTEVRKLVLLTPEEMKKFEETMTDLISAQNSYKSCPGCNSYVARADLSNLRVHCTVCSAEKGQLYEFCWQCLQQWKGSQWCSDSCDNDDCMTDLELLKTCPTVTFSVVQGVTGCPSTRACPTCGVLVEHDKTGCKNIECKNCNKEFCFVCLKLTTECLKTSKYFLGCSAGVAPRQTSIPSWSGT